MFAYLHQFARHHQCVWTPPFPEPLDFIVAMNTWGHHQSWLYCVCHYDGRGFCLNTGYYSSINVSLLLTSNITSCGADGRSHVLRCFADFKFLVCNDVVLLFDVSPQPFNR